MFLTPRFHSSRSVRRQLSEHGPCPRLVHDASTNSRTGRPPFLGVESVRVLDVRIFVKISRPGDPDPISPCPRLVHDASTNSRTGRPPFLGVESVRVLDVRTFVKISRSGDPDPISFLTKILTSKTRARSPVRTEGALSAACPRHVHKLADSRVLLVQSPFAAE
jgi:hypothetical protein